MSTKKSKDPPQKIPRAPDAWPGRPVMPESELDRSEQKIPTARITTLGIPSQPDAALDELDRSEKPKLDFRKLEVPVGPLPTYPAKDVKKWKDPHRPEPLLSRAGVLKEQMERILLMGVVRQLREKMKRAVDMLGPVLDHNGIAKRTKEMLQRELADTGPEEDIEGPPDPLGNVRMMLLPLATVPSRKLIYRNVAGLPDDTCECPDCGGMGQVLDPSSNTITWPCKNCNQTGRVKIEPIQSREELREATSEAAKRALERFTPPSDALLVHDEMTMIHKDAYRPPSEEDKVEFEPAELLKLKEEEPLIVPATEMPTDLGASTDQREQEFWQKQMEKEMEEEEPKAICTLCGRKTWANIAGSKCNMLQPNDKACQGIMAAPLPEGEVCDTCDRNPCICSTFHLK